MPPVSGRVAEWSQRRAYSSYHRLSTGVSINMHLYTEIIKPLSNFPQVLFCTTPLGHR